MDYLDIYSGPDKTYNCSPFMASRGFTLLMRLCHNEKRRIPIEEIKQYIVNHPEEINQTNQERWTALMLICNNIFDHNSLKIMKLLLNHGADPNLLNSIEMPALILTESCNNKRFRYKARKILLKNGANPNEGDRNGNNTLMYEISSANTYYKNVKLLVDYGIDVNAQNWMGNTALILTVTCRDKFVRQKIVDLLLEYNANTKLKNDFGTSALKLAHRWDHDGTYKPIIKRLRKKNLKKLESYNQILKNKNKALRQLLKDLPEGNHIMELYYTFGGST